MFDRNEVIWGSHLPDEVPSQFELKDWMIYSKWDRFMDFMIGIVPHFLVCGVVMLIMLMRAGTLSLLLKIL